MEIKAKKILINGRFTTNQLIKINNGIIENISPYEGTDFDYDYLAPALVDIHINGGEKYHFTADPTREALKDLEESAKKNGVAYVMPTLITSSPENIFTGLEAVKAYMNANPHSGVLGMHLEGPFISVEKKGAHIERYIRKPDTQILQEIIDRGKGVLKMITIAPEHFSNEQIKMLLDSDIRISLGHSNCSYERAMEVFDMGVNLVTHLFNAMSPLTHRQPGLAGAALMHPEVYTPIILDGDHVSFEVAKLALKLKKEKLLFISDALFLNHIKETFVWEEFDAKLENNKYINSDGNLAGGNISQADCFVNGIKELNLSLEESFVKSACLPAESLNLKVGKIEQEYPAKFVTLDVNDPKLQLKNVGF